MLIKKFSFIYIYLFLCGNKQKYEVIKQIIEVQEENELFKEKYMETIRSLTGLYESGTLVLNQKTLEKVNLYLETNKVLRVAG